MICSKVHAEPVLDIGCGTGAFMRLLEARGKKSMGIEPNPELIRLAHALNPSLNIRQGTAEEMLHPQGPFGTITLIDVLEHIPDDELQLQKIGASLTPQGRLILVVPAYPFLYGARDKAIGHCRRYTKMGLVQKLRKCHFEIQEIRHWNVLGFLPYLIYQRMFRGKGTVSLRFEKQKNALSKLATRLLLSWYAMIENRIDFGVGLSLICVASKQGE